MKVLRQVIIIDPIKLKVNNICKLVVKLKIINVNTIIVKFIIMS